MLDPFTMEMLLRLRREDDLRWAVSQRQVRVARVAAGRPALQGVTNWPGLEDLLVRLWLALRAAG
jgi:hypothetical protein